MMRAAEHRWAARLQRTPRLYRAVRQARERLGDLLPVRDVPGIGPVHPNDLMFVDDGEGAAARYRQQGEEAAGHCHRAAALVDLEVTDLLDLGCGHGRCLRFLRTRWPDARIVGADVDPSAVEFCRSSFDAIGVVLPTDRIEVPPGPFDLIWVGSVFTHLPLAAAADLLRAMREQLRAGGVAVVTTHAGDTVDTLVDDPAKRAEVRAQLDAGGAAFVPYRDERSYGLTWFDDAYVRTLAGSVGLTPLDHARRGWGGFQDVWILT